MSSRASPLRPPLGFTLAEVLVVGFIGLVVLGLMMQLLLPSVWMFRVESARSEAQQACLLVANRLQQSLLNSSVESIYVGADPVSISFQEVAETGQPFDVVSGAPVLAPYFRVIWYDAPTRRVLMKVWPPEPPASAAMTTPFDFAAPSAKPQRILYGADQQAIINGPSNGREQVMARNVERLYLTDYGNDADNDMNLLTPPLEMTIECSVDTSMQGTKTKEVYTTTIKVVPRTVRW